MRAAGPIQVEAPARIHLGLIDLRGDLGRRFGGTGMALREPSLLLEAWPAAELEAEGAEADRLLPYARRFLDHHGLRAGARLRLRRGIPAHSGLGSGTQLALATARALAVLNGVPADAASLAAAVGRARRSAIGTWAFEHGGFILEGGRRADDDAPGPLVLRRAVPESWRCVLAIPDVERGLSGEAEERAFRVLPKPSAELIGEISRLVLVLLLPSLVDGDLAGFGRAVTEMQRLVGEVFRSVQGAPFAHPLVRELIDELLAGGAAGAGQSSWGPAVYGFVEGDAAARALAARVEARLGGRGLVLATGFDNAGARWVRRLGVRPARPRAE
ncbi:MAG TPA: beta-ribofuranosylaminobenzene 5'-phosphate synthase family protein [Longimicrobiales bacterium]|nr:beta-ribofuranosylaminobenzene 5'-phosphate synthase family protein [Longimicrobiales bacterium]